MRDKHYKIRTMRLSDKTWEALRERRWKSRKGWNQFVMELLEKKHGNTK